MALSNRWKKKEEIKQGLKICLYGENGCGKSLVALAFPDNAIVDSEAKLGTYADNDTFNKNILAVADTSSYYETIDMIKEIVEDKDKPCQTLTIDSETKIYDALSVACMETEEARAIKKGKDVTDQTVSMRGYGKIKLNAQRLSALKAMASSKGITVITVAHEEDVCTGEGENRVKIGVRPNLRKKAEHDQDIIIRFSKEKDLGSGQFKYIAIPEKDTTGTFTLGQKIDCTWKSKDEPNTVIYDMLKDKIEKASCGTKGGSYSSVDKDITKAMEESESNDDVINEFTELFKVLSADADKKARVAQLLKDNGIKSYKDEATIPQLKLVIAEMKTM